MWRRQASVLRVARSCVQSCIQGIDPNMRSENSPLVKTILSATVLSATVVVCAAVLPLSVRADDVLIEMFQNAFLPQAVEVEVGDTVTWVWRRGNHTVTSGLGPGDPQAGALFDATVDEAHPQFELTIGVEHVGGVPFFDRVLPAQQGFIQVSAGEETIRVGVVDNVFIPEILCVFANDSVRWEHEPMEDFHTVTSGRSSNPEDSPGALFDEDSSDELPIFVYQFTMAGEYPYFCRPHEHLAMVGTIFVQKLFLRGDTTGDAALDISDAVATLNFLFAGTGRPFCDDAMDSNDDGQVDIADPIFALGYLFLGTEEIPRPFPLRGADRTEDELLCMP
jgi:plastocyanin